MTFILDLFHTFEYATAGQALTPDKGERKAYKGSIKEQMNAGQGAQVIVALKLRSRQPEAVAVCIDYCEVNADRMRCDLCRKRGLPVGAGVVESACKHIVGNRFKESGCSGSKAGTNALLAFGCCLENMRWPDFLNWRAGRVASA